MTVVTIGSCYLMRSEVLYHNFYKTSWGLVQYSRFPLQSFVFILLHVHTLFWEGVPRPHQREATVQRRWRPLLQWRGGSEGLGSLWIPLPLLGTAFFRVTSFLTPVSWPLAAPGPRHPQRPSMLSETDPQGSARLSLEFCFEAVQMFVDCFPVRVRGTGRCLASLSPSPSPAPQSWHSVWGAGKILFRVN